MIGEVSGEVKFAGSPPINAESLSQEGLGLRTGIQKINNADGHSWSLLSSFSISYPIFVTLTFITVLLIISNS